MCHMASACTRVRFSLNDEYGQHARWLHCSFMHKNSVWVCFCYIMRVFLGRYPWSFASEAHVFFLSIHMKGICRERLTAQSKYPWFPLKWPWEKRAESWESVRMDKWTQESSWLIWRPQSWQLTAKASVVCFQVVMTYLFYCWLF